MKKLAIISITIISIFLFSNCKKNDGHTNNSTGMYFTKGAKYTSSNRTVNTGDTLIFNWDMESEEGMRRLYIEENGSSTASAYTFKTMGNTFFTSSIIDIPEELQYYYSDTFALKAASAGTKTIRFTITNENGDVLLRKDITIDVAPDFNYFTWKVLSVPDSTSKINPCYLDIDNCSTFSYSDLNTDIMPNIDLGYYCSATSSVKHTLYSLSSNQFPYYDLSSFGAVNKTYIKKLTSVTKANIRSAADIATGCGNIGTLEKLENIGSGNIIGFKTAAGKYGIMWVTYLNYASYAPDNFIRFEMKVQK